MTYTLDIDPVARAQIRELSPAGAVALADALAVLELVPERGEMDAAPETAMIIVLPASGGGSAGSNPAGVTLSDLPGDYSIGKGNAARTQHVAAPGSPLRAGVRRRLRP